MSEPCADKYLMVSDDSGAGVSTHSSQPSSATMSVGGQHVEETKTQATALHRLVSTQPTAEDVREAIATNPGFVATADERGCTPLHVALASHAGMDVVKALIDANPETAGVADKNGICPIHIAIRTSQPASVVGFILDACPEAAVARPRHGNIPLLAACRMGATEAVIKRLMDAHPASSTVINERSGNTALHYYVFGPSAKRCKISVLTDLLNANPTSIKQPNVRGNLPLKIAVCYEAPVGVVQRLFDEYPAAIDVIDQYGENILHAAVACNPQIAVLRFLLRAKPSLSSQTNKRGQLPFHNALNAGALPEVVNVTLEAYPEAADIEDPDDTYGGALELNAPVPRGAPSAPTGGFANKNRRASNGHDMLAAEVTHLAEYQAQAAEPKRRCCSIM